jgi:hypothetical protein
VLAKLRWCKDRGNNSARQWNDPRNIVKIQGDRLHLPHMREWADILEIGELLMQLLNE